MSRRSMVGLAAGYAGVITLDVNVG